MRFPILKLMKPHKPWVEALHISAKDFSSWAQLAPALESLTFWCIETGKIDGQNYLQWARNHFGLASLNADFFTREPDAQFWQKIQSVANWSAELAPICEWDNTVYVACVEPDTDVQWSFPVRYVLALPDDLKRYWSQLQTTQEKSFVDMPTTPDRQPNVESNPQISGTALPQIAIDDAPEIVFEESVNAPAPGSAPAPAPVAIKIEAPIVVDKPLSATDGEPAGINLSVLNSEPKVKERDFMAELSKEVKSNVDLNSPDNLTWKPKADEAAAAAAPDGIKLDFSSISIAKPDAAPPLPPVVPSAPVVAAKPPPIVAPSPIIAPPPIIASPSPAVTLSNVPPAAPPVAPPPVTPITAATPKPASATGGAFEETTQFIRLLPEFKMNFAGGMVIKVSGDNFTAACWDETFQPSAGSDPKKVWNLNPPSAFRVAYRTAMPYLGQVVDTPINKEFFASWGFEVLPKVVLVKPIKVNEKITHFVLLISDGLKKNHMLLSEGERIAELFLQSTNQKKAA